MVRFLINRPIAVTMTLVAIMTLGILAMKLIPVSLMPDVDIPQITVQVSEKGLSARQINGSIISLLRQQLMQVAGLRDIHSETRDGSAVVRLNFDFGTNTDLAFSNSIAQCADNRQFVFHAFLGHIIEVVNFSDSSSFYNRVVRSIFGI